MACAVSPYLRWVHDHTTPVDYDFAGRRINDHGLFFVREGRGAIAIDGVRQAVAPGSLVLVRPHLEHGVSAAPGTRMHMLNIHFDLVERDDSAATGFVQDPRAPRALPAEDIVPAVASARGFLPTFSTVDRVAYEQLFRRVHVLYPLRDALAGGLEIKAAMLDLLAFLHRRDADAEALPESVADTARRAADHIQARFAEALTIADIARASHAARSTLMRAFRAAYRTTPMAYLRGVRIARAKQELLLGRLPPKAIATAVGFESVHHFTRVFSAATGLPPAAFRRRFARR